MSDLPRFYEGGGGRRDFTALNEMMRRLDLLLPVIESASLSESREMSERSKVFLVKAERLEGSSRYAWKEAIVSSSDKILVEVDDDWGDVADLDIHYRQGGYESEDEEDPWVDAYAVLFDPAVVFDEGLSLCVAVSRADKVKRYLLFPLSAQALPTIFKVGGGGSEAVVDFGDGSVSATRYSGTAYTQPGDEESEWTSNDATMWDLSSVEINEPIHNSGATMEYHTLVSGTYLTPSFVSKDTAFLGTLPRLDFQCK